jgi:hypothetical protein
MEGLLANPERIGHDAHIPDTGGIQADQDRAYDAGLLAVSHHQCLRHQAPDILPGGRIGNDSNLSHRMLTRHILTT